MEKKIEKLKTEMSETYGERLAFDHWEELEYSVIDEIGLKLNEVIDRLNSQAQPEENEPEKVYVEPIVPNFTEELSAPVEYKTRKQVKEMFKDTPEEWEELTKEEWFMLKLAVNEIHNKGNGAYDEISRKIDRLSKLKDNK